MIEALESGVLKAVWIVCTNPVVSLPDARRVEAALRNARFIVVQDISAKSDTVEFADLVLPAAGHFEKEGTMTNSERRISLLNKVIDPPGEALPDVDILCAFAREMGFSGFEYKNVAEIYAEHARLTAGTNIDVNGLSYERLRKQGSMQWPVPTNEHPGTPRLFTDRKFFTPSGRARFVPSSSPHNQSEVTSGDFPLILTTGRIRDQWHTMTKTGKVNKLKQHIDKPFLQIHPHDALTRSINSGDVVVVTNDRGEVRVCATVTDEVKKGVVFLPMHWGRRLQTDFGRANNLTSRIVDPVSKEPDFKFSAVEVHKYEKPAERIVIIGAGAAAYRFICTYRNLNNTDEIVVFSKEKDSFYNRVLLPEYVSDKLSWQRLQKFDEQAYNAAGITLSTDNEIKIINRQEKYIEDRDGNKHHYDKLILATGSRANIPKDAPVHLPGVFTMRTRQDADALKARVAQGSHVLIVGGGLLGLELAASLREMDARVSILQLGSRLMERQIDDVSGQLLLDFIDEIEIKVYLNDQVQTVEEHGSKQLIVRLRSEIRLMVDAIVYAVGTKPNIELPEGSPPSDAAGSSVSEEIRPLFSRTCGTTTVLRVVGAPSSLDRLSVTPSSPTAAPAAEPGPGLRFAGSFPLAGAGADEDDILSKAPPDAPVSGIATPWDLLLRDEL
jgi:ferredoxin-nitrate reductase